MAKSRKTTKHFEDYENFDIHQISLFDSMSDEQKLMLGITDEKPKKKINVDSFKRTKGERKRNEQEKNCLLMPKRVKIS